MTTQKSDDRTLMWVHPEFSKLMKISATQKGISMIDFTKEISLNPKPLMDYVMEKKNEKKRYDFF